MRRERYSREEVNRLTRRALQGKEESLKELKNYYSYLAKIANSRLYRLEKEGLDYYAYDYAQAFTEVAYDSKRYSTAMQEPKAMREQIRNIEKFLSMKTSSVAQAKLVRDNRMAIFRERFGIANESQRPEGDESQFGLYMSDEMLHDFTRYLSTKPMRKLISESIYTSEEVMDVLREKYDKGGVTSMKEIERLASKWQYISEMKLEDDENYHYDDLWKELTSGTRIGKQIESERQRLEKENPWRN